MESETESLDRTVEALDLAHDCDWNTFTLPICLTRRILFHPKPCAPDVQISVSLNHRFTRLDDKAQKALDSLPAIVFHKIARSAFREHLSKKRSARKSKFTLINTSTLTTLPDRRVQAARRAAWELELQRDALESQRR